MAGYLETVSFSTGRKKVLGLSAILAGLSGLASAAAPAYWWYMGLRVCSGVAATGMTLAAGALAVEPVGPTWRGMAGVATCFFSILGGLLTTLVALLVSQLDMNAIRCYSQTTLISCFCSILLQYTCLLLHCNVAVAVADCAEGSLWLAGAWLADVDTLGGSGVPAVPSSAAIHA